MLPKERHRENNTSLSIKIGYCIVESEDYLPGAAYQVNGSCKTDVTLLSSGDNATVNKFATETKIITCHRRSHVKPLITYSRRRRKDSLITYSGNRRKDTLITYSRRRRKDSDLSLLNSLSIKQCEHATAKIANKIEVNTHNVRVDDLNNLIENIRNEDMTRSLTRAPTGSSRKKLLVLDVNGLLADIVSPNAYVSRGYKPDRIVSGKAVFKRPFCDEFLKFCFQRFNVGIWSSRKKRNLEQVVCFLMEKVRHNLLFCWDQSHCTVTGYYTLENNSKPLLLKELKKLWEKSDPDLPWEREEYNESNTLLLDDSPYKALCNPPNTAIFPCSYQYMDESDNSLGPGGDLYVHLEGLAEAADVRMYVEHNPFGQPPITEQNASWDFYLKVKESSISKPSQSSHLSGKLQ